MNQPSRSGVCELVGCGAGTRTRGLLVMSQSSCRCSTPRKSQRLIIIRTSTYKCNSCQRSTGEHKRVRVRSGGPKQTVREPPSHPSCAGDSQVGGSTPKLTGEVLGPISSATRPRHAWSSAGWSASRRTSRLVTALRAGRRHHRLPPDDARHRSPIGPNASADGDDDAGYSQEERASGDANFALFHLAAALAAEQQFVARLGGLWLLSSAQAEAAARDALQLVRQTGPMNELDHSWLRGLVSSTNGKIHEFLR